MSKCQLSTNVHPATKELAMRLAAHKGMKLNAFLTGLVLQEAEHLNVKGTKKLASEVSKATSGQ